MKILLKFLIKLMSSVRDSDPLLHEDNKRVSVGV
jgi:hypothetical protein